MKEAFWGTLFGLNMGSMVLTANTSQNVYSLVFSGVIAVLCGERWWRAINEQ
jgi:hypothetical protein